jgi:hypothetical protein
MSVSPPLQGGRRLPLRRQYFDPEQVTAIYENPVTGWREAVPRLAWLWMLLFTGIYMAVRSLWRPLGLMLLVVFGTSFFFWPLLLIVAPGLSIFAAFKAQDIFRNHYMRLGWYEIDPWQQDDEE